MQTIRIGRNPGNDIRINKDTVSSFHAEIRLQDNGTIMLYDNSTNGTSVNGQAVPRGMEIPVRRGDRILIAKETELDWNQIPQVGVPAAGAATPKKTTPKWVYAAAAALAAMALFYFIPSAKPNDPAVGKIAGTDSSRAVKPAEPAKMDVFEEYKNSVVLVVHQFAFKVRRNESDENPILLTLVNGRFVPLGTQGSAGIDISGTGFFVSGDGKLITNRHVAMPWEYGDLKKKADQLKDDFERGGYPNVIVTGHTTYLGYSLKDTYVRGITDLKGCGLYKESGKDEIDLAVLRSNDSRTPDIVKNYIHLDNAITDVAAVKPGLKLQMIGYPMGFRLGVTTEGLKPDYQNGQISAEPDAVQVRINNASTGGASGSPVFTEQGRLVGVLHAGMTNTQGYNFAILAKHAVELAK